MRILTKARASVSPESSFMERREAGWERARTLTYQPKVFLLTQSVLFLYFYRTYCDSVLLMIVRKMKIPFFKESGSVTFIGMHDCKCNLPSPI